MMIIVIAWATQCVIASRALDYPNCHDHKGVQGSAQNPDSSWEKERIELEIGVGLAHSRGHYCVEANISPMRKIRCPEDMAKPN